MRFDVITIFPDIFASFLSESLMAKAIEKKLLEVRVTTPRDFAADRHHTSDDRPYGGGPGMVMLPEPLARSLRSLGHGTRPEPGRRILYMSPKGRPFDQALARELAEEKDLTLICGRYEGIDARLLELFPIEEVSVGDFVLNGGETAALAVCEAACRLLPGFMGHEESGEEESFNASLLEYPHYTRPEEFEGLAVPEVLRSGDHARINRWRRDEALLATLRVRPKLLEGAHLDDADRALLRGVKRKTAGRNLYLALLHYPVLDREQKSVSTALTNLDIHDIARSSRSYGLGGFIAVTPLKDQQLILREILCHWVGGPGSRSNPDRQTALEKVIPANSLEEAVEIVEKRHGERPALWSSSARSVGTISFDEARNFLYTGPAIILLGTGHGLAPEVTEKCVAELPPLRWAAPYNHLSVRSAAAIMLDRILGEFD